MQIDLIAQTCQSMVELECMSCILLIFQYHDAKDQYVDRLSGKSKSLRNEFSERKIHLKNEFYLAGQFEHQTKHTVSGWMLWSKI